MGLYSLMQIPAGESIKLWRNTDAQLRGAERRKFRAGVVRSIGKGGQVYAAKTLKWGRNTIRKGEHELKSGCDFEDQFHLRGRKPAEHHLPNLLPDIKGIIEPRSQADPTFKSTRVYTPLTAESVRTRLLEDFDYEDSSLPCSRTLSNKINGLGYSLKK